MQRVRCKRRFTSVNAYKLKGNVAEVNAVQSPLVADKSGEATELGGIIVDQVVLHNLGLRPTLLQLPEVGGGTSF